MDLGGHTSLASGRPRMTDSAVELFVRRADKLTSPSPGVLFQYIDEINGWDNSLSGCAHLYVLDPFSFSLSWTGPGYLISEARGALGVVDGNVHALVACSR